MNEYRSAMREIDVSKNRNEQDEPNGSFASVPAKDAKQQGTKLLLAWLFTPTHARYPSSSRHTRIHSQAYTSA